MKRRIVVPLGAILMLLAACGAPEPGVGGGQARRQDDGWTAAPRITAVERQGTGGLVVRGAASPGARVVLRGGQDAVFAAGADATGRFELNIGRLTAPVVLTPEVQIGQYPAPGPERLLLVEQAEAPLAALLVEGQASRRLSPAPALDVVDGDGAGLVASGRGRPGARISVSADGSTPVTVGVSADGRWVAALPSTADRATRITVGEIGFDYPGPGSAGDRIERAGSGWRVAQVLSPSARLTSWFPDM